MSYIEFKQISKCYGKNEVLKKMDLSIHKGELITLLGPSGCGKSTLLRCLAGLEKATSGSIFVDGQDITERDVSERQIGMVFQKYSLFPNMTVEENIGFGLKVMKVDKNEVQRRTQEMIEMVGLEGKEDHYPRQLSGGQQQRVALARAIITEPKVLLLDEPLSAIDALLRKKLQEQIKQIVKKLGITTIFVTHDQDEAMVISDRVYLFNDGKIEQCGTPVEMYAHPKTYFAARFMGNYNIVKTHEFNRLVGDRFGAKHIAIRPEVIEVAPERPVDVEGTFVFRAKVEDSMSHGNVLRYTLRAENGVKLKSEVLFRSFKLFDIGQELYVSIEKRNCLEINE